jgi:bifunctional DNA-binding transcriptional regulator/antitoxin component of YhaV-PrlF toxin-antitoxin module
MAPLVNAFRAELQLVPHGGQYVVVPEKVATRTGLKHGVRVRGTVNGVPYRSSLMKYSGIFHLGVHKATLAKAGAKGGDRVLVTIELDREPLPTDTVPDDLAAALKKSSKARAAWKTLRPSLKREYVKSISSAKKPETRSRRVKQTLVELAEGTRRNYTPK